MDSTAEILSQLALDMPCPTCKVYARRLCRNDQREVLDWLHGSRVAPITKAFYMGTMHPRPRQTPVKQGET